MEKMFFAKEVDETEEIDEKDKKILHLEQQLNETIKTLENTKKERNDILERETKLLKIVIKYSSVVGDQKTAYRFCYHGNIFFQLLNLILTVFIFSNVWYIIFWSLVSIISSLIFDFKNFKIDEEGVLEMIKEYARSCPENIKFMKDEIKKYDEKEDDYDIDNENDSESDGVVSFDDLEDSDSSDGGLKMKKE